MSSVYDEDLLTGVTIAARENDGSENSPDGGEVFGSYVRVTANSYGSADGSEWDEPDANGGANDPRAISTDVLATSGNTPAHEGVNEFFQFFGQMITHDIAGSKGGSGETVTGLDAHVFGGTFTRDDFVISDESPLNPGVREQIGIQTTYMDLSQVYGPSDETNALLRDPDSAKLLTSAGGLMPKAVDVAEAHDITEADAASDTLGAVNFGGGPVGFVGGDARLNQQAQLLANQTLFLRNHNWHVDQLEELHPDWSTERLYQTARALNEADFQHVVYDEYLAKLLGKDALSDYAGYKASVDPRVINEWTTVAFRFGHDQASASDAKLAEDGTGTTVDLGDNFVQSFLSGDGITSRGDLDQWVRGELSQAAQEIDGKVTDGVRNELLGLGFDLAAVDIARGDDHGVGDYNALRDGLGLPTYASFDAFASANRVEAATLSALKTVYGDDISELDSIVGALLEKEAPGSMLGETATILTVMQFENTRDADKYWYEERFADHPELIEAIQDISFADIIARDTGIRYVYRDAFAASGRVGGDPAANKLAGGDSRDLVFGLAGQDTLSGGGAADDIHGGAGRDILRGNKGHDMLVGGGANDTLYGGQHADSLDGGKGSDRLIGGSDTDTFVFSGGGYDHVADFSWRETLDLSAYSEFTSLADVRAAVTERHGNLTIHLDDGAVILEDYAGHGLAEHNFIFAHPADIALTPGGPATLAAAPDRPTPSRTMTLVRYFAYGSNMFTPRLRARVASARPLGHATIEGYVLGFGKRSLDGSGKAAALPGAGTLDGVLFEIEAADLMVLDRYEGPGYTREPVDVLAMRGEPEAFVYIARRDYFEAGLRPYDWYQALILAGAREHGLPPDALARLGAIPATWDPVPDRATRLEALRLLGMFPAR